MKIESKKMLQAIREYTQGWIAGTIIGIIILTFALWGIHSYFTGSAPDTNVAEVNGINITKEQLAVAYERLRRQMQIQYGANSQNFSKNEAALKDRALQALIDIEVLRQASLRQGYRIFDPQVDNYLESMPEFQVNGQFSLERFKEVLSSTLLSISEFLELIRTSLLLDQPKLGIVLTAFALPDETAYTISLVNQERDIQYVSIPLQHFLTGPIAISPQKIQDYYAQHKIDFMTPEQVNVEYLELSQKAIAEKMQPTESALKSFYNENINSYTQPMKWKFSSMEVPVSSNASQNDMVKVEKNAETIAELMKTQNDLSKIAHDHQANLSINDWMTLNQVPSDWQKSVAELTKPLQVNGPFKTNKGFVILKAIDVQSPKIQTFDEVKEKVKEAYVHQHAEEKFAELREQLADTTYEHPDSLKFAAKALDLPIKTSELFTKEKPGKDISQYKKVRDVAFSNDVLGLQNNSDVIQVNPDTIVVLRVKSHVPSALLSLNSVTKQIEEKLKMDEAQTQADNFAHDLQKKLQAGGNPESLINAAKLTWVNVGFIGRYSTRVDSAILDLAFRLANPAAMKNKTLYVYGVTRLPNGGYAIVALKSVKKGAVTDAKQDQVFAEQVQSSDGVLEYELYKLSQTEKAKVKINKQTF